MKKIKIILITIIFISFFFMFKINVNASDIQNITNVVIFTKFKGDTNEVFNDQSKWDEIKSLYDKELYYGNDVSFKNYIKTISEGKLGVTNYFPQENNNTVLSFELENSSSYYTNSDSIVSEVIKAINDSKINFNTNIKMDNIKSGILDNLTIVVQGSTNTNSSISPHKADYPGTETLKGLGVRYYNIFSSSTLLGYDGKATATHEFLHVLGFPDLYYSTGYDEPVGIWDIMGKADLQYPLSYLRAKKDWVDLNYIEKKGTYTLTAVSENGDNKVFAIKTPLNDSEYIVLEYRKKHKNNFDSRIPYSGLLLYRVNENIEEKSNIAGKNYIYVYRNGVTNLSEEAKGSISTIDKNIALSPDIGKTEYGSIDLSKTYLDNTLYYSDGTNSGVKISNVKFSNDKNQITFDVDFANYGDYWEDIGTLTDDSKGVSSIYNDKEGNVYASYTTGSYSSPNIMVKKFNKNNKIWEVIGNTISKSNFPNLVKFKNDLYLECLDYTKNQIYYYKLINSIWVKIGEEATYANNSKLISTESTLYSMNEYTENITTNLTKIVVKDILNNKIIFEKKAQNFGNASLYEYQNKLFFVHSNVFGTNKKGVIESYDLKSKRWNTEITSTIESSTSHLITENNGKLYIFIGSPNSSPHLYIYDGNRWEEKKISIMDNFIDSSINVVNDKIYISYIDNVTQKSNIILIDENKMKLFDDKLSGGYTYLNVVISDNYFYALAKNNNSIITKRKSIINNEIQITSISLNKNQITLKEGEKNTLIASLSPSNTTQSKVITWSISDENIASVDSNGNIIAKKAGIATITAKTINGKFTTCKLTVEKNQTEISKDIKVKYKTHIQNIGWQNYVSNGEMSGTSGQSLRLEGIKIILENQKYDGDIEYKTHIQNIGWENTWRKNGKMSGTSGKSLRLEAIQIRLTGTISQNYDVYYRVHSQNFGWLDWAKNGEKAGTAGYSYRLEAIEIKLVKKGMTLVEKIDNPFIQREVSYSTHIQNIGWQNYVSNGEMSGTSGQSLRLEGIKIILENQKYDGDIEYKTHIQNIGWENTWRKNGKMSGTSGKSLRLEAIQIRLTGTISQNYDVYYRVHSQNFGWLDWAKNGEKAGTAGYSYRLEGIQIQLIKKGKTFQGSTVNRFIGK